MKNIEPKGKCLKGYFIFHILFLLLLVTSGCGNKFFDPTQVGRFDHTPSVNVILDALGVAEEVPAAWEVGEEPRPADTIVPQNDYALMSGDIIEISINELFGQGMMYKELFEISETGKISVPDVGVINIVGRTEFQIEEMIANVLRPAILVNPVVHVKLMQSQHRAYSIQGDGVNLPGRYPIEKNDWTLLDALAEAKGVSQKNVSNIYIMRKEKKKNRNSGVSKNRVKDFRTIQSAYNLEKPITYDPLKSKPVSNNPISKLIVSSTEMVSDRERERPRSNDWRNPGGRLNLNVYQFSDMRPDDIENRVSVDEVLNRVTGRPVNNTQEPVIEPSPGQNNFTQPYREESAVPEQSSHIEWVFQNGEWVAVEVESPSSSGTVNVRENDNTTTMPQVTNNIPRTIEETPDEPIDWELRDGQWVPVKRGQSGGETIPNTISRPQTNNIEPEFTWSDEDTETRLIQIPVDKLLAADPRYDIIIKPGDSILVPHDVTGEYTVMGNVLNRGSVEMTSGKVTLKQVIAKAGLGPLAWPERCEITRRIAPNKEEIVRVDLEKIFNGEQPNIYIKPHDLINVGTHATSIWRAVLRNSFRATYGFGFVYDRNFANDDYYSSRWFD